jgi:hypothetical protein
VHLEGDGEGDFFDAGVGSEDEVLFLGFSLGEGRYELFKCVGLVECECETVSE